MWQHVVLNNRKYFEEYLGLIKSKIDQETSILDREYIIFEKGKKLEKKIDEYDWEDHFAGRAYEVEELEQLLYRSFIVSVFMFMEKTLAELCDYLFIRDKDIFSYKDLKGNGVSRALNFLQKKLNKKFPKDEQLKIDFDIAQIIRNSIVHTDGKINLGDKTKILQQIKNNLPIAIDRYNNSIKLSYKYALKVLDINDGICTEISNNWKITILEI